MCVPADAHVMLHHEHMTTANAQPPRRFRPDYVTLGRPIEDLGSLRLALG